jgi:hypothetical protein
VLRGRDRLSLAKPIGGRQREKHALSEEKALLERFAKAARGER